MTPISRSRTRYLYASGVVSGQATDEILDKRMAVVTAHRLWQHIGAMAADFAVS